MRLGGGVRVCFIRIYSVFMHFVRAVLSVAGEVPVDIAFMC